MAGIPVEAEARVVVTGVTRRSLILALQSFEQDVTKESFLLTWSRCLPSKVTTLTFSGFGPSPSAAPAGAIPPARTAATAVATNARISFLMLLPREVVG